MGRTANASMAARSVSVVQDQVLEGLNAVAHSHRSFKEAGRVGGTAGLSSPAERGIFSSPLHPRPNLGNRALSALGVLVVVILLLITSSL